MSSDVVRWLLTVPANKLKSLPNSHHRQLNKTSDTMNTHKTTAVLNNNTKLMNKKISWPLLRRNLRVNLFPINYFQFIFFIWLVINFNVNLVFSDNNLNNFLNNNEINPSGYYRLNVTDNNDNNSSYSNRISSSDSGSNDNSNEYDFKINHNTSNSDRKNSDFLFNEHNIFVDGDFLSEKHFTPTWAVHIPGGDLEADRVAEEHGFQNLGKVSCILLFFRLHRLKFKFQRIGIESSRCKIALFSILNENNQDLKRFLFMP